MAEKKPIEKNKPNEIYITRIYNAPVKIVWGAWTDPAQAANWWGPRGFTLTNHSKEFRVGGQWKYTMHGPDGTDYPNIATYHEIEKYSRLVYDHGATETTPPLFRVTVTFEEIQGGKTKMEMAMALPNEEAAKQTKKFIKQAGGNGTWDRLAEYLGKRVENKEKFVINRSFEAPVETMFEMWTNPKHFSQWLAPTGFKMEFLKADIKTGGKTSYSMSNGVVTMYGRAEYLKVEKPNFLQYTQQFCDKDGNVSRHPMAPTWPETMLTTVRFNSEGANQTRITIEWEVVGQATAQEMETFLAGRAGMTQGWTGSFDKLEEYLEQHS